METQTKTQTAIAFPAIQTQTNADKFFVGFKTREEYLARRKVWSAQFANRIDDIRGAKGYLKNMIGWGVADEIPNARTEYQAALGKIHKLALIRKAMKAEAQRQWLAQHPEQIDPTIQTMIDDARGLIQG